MKPYRFPFFLFLILILSIGRSQATAYDNETHNFGSACTATKANGADWDTLFQCSGGLWKRAPYFFGATTNVCSAANAGMVQWTGSAFQFCNGTASDWSALTLTNTGNMGIGTTAPGFPLTVKTTGNISSTFWGTSNGPSGLIHIQNSNASSSWNLGIETGSGWASGTAGSLYIDLNGIGPKVAILPSGNVGIGTVAPAAMLDVNGGVKIGPSSTCDAPHAGTIQWDGSYFYGCNGSSWVKLGSASCSPGQCTKSDGSCGSITIHNYWYIRHAASCGSEYWMYYGYDLGSVPGSGGTYGYPADMWCTDIRYAYVVASCD